MIPSVSYTPYATSSMGETGNIITFAQFEQRDSLSETRDYTESGNKSDGDYTMSPLISKGKMDTMDSGYESNDEPMSTDMLEDIFDVGKSHPRINRRQARYKYVIPLN